MSRTAKAESSEGRSVVHSVWLQGIYAIRVPYRQSKGRLVVYRVYL
jgi:hypothetical protein